MTLRAGSGGSSLDRRFLAVAPRRGRRRFIRLVAAFSVLCVLCAVGYLVRAKWPIETLLRDGRRALVRGDASAALGMAQRAVGRAGNSVAAWRLLAESAELVNDAPQTLAALTRLTELDEPRAANYWMRIGRCELGRQRIRWADEALRQALSIDACEADALRLCAQLRGALGRPQEEAKCLMQLIQCKSMEPADLLRLASVETIADDRRLIDSMLRDNPDEWLANLARARRALDENESAQAEQLLKTLVAAEPQCWEA